MRKTQRHDACVDEPAADERADHERDARPRRPRADRGAALLAAEGRRDHGEPGRREERAGDALQAARDDQRRAVRRGGAEDRRDAEARRSRSGRAAARRTGRRASRRRGAASRASAGRRRRPTAGARGRRRGRRWIAGSATLTTVESTNTIAEPRMQATRTSRLRVSASGVRYSQTEGGGGWRLPDRALEDVDDWLGDYPGEMRGITYAIGAEQVALTYRRMPQHTGARARTGTGTRRRRRSTSCSAGSCSSSSTTRSSRSAHEAVRDPAADWRGVWNDEPEDAELIIVSTGSTIPGDTETTSRTSGLSSQEKVPARLPATRSARPQTV